MDELLLDPGLKAFVDAIQGIKEIDNDDLDDNIMEVMKNTLDQAFSVTMINQAMNQMIQNLEMQGSSKEDAKAAFSALKDVINEMLYVEDPPIGNKKILIDNIVDRLYSMFDAVLAKYHMFNIELPMTVDITAGAKVPTYAHDTDAAADLYAMEDQIIPAHSYGNMIKTGVKIQLPEGWLAFILPRSSTGLKTPLRLSNSVGLIDSGYRGELGVIYDNTSDNDYQIKAGDRIAQLLVMPSYRFQPKVVEVLADSDRGEGGFGASGK